MQPQPDEVPVELAFQAAQDRALRTTSALLMSEAHVLTLKAQLERERAESGERIARLHERIRELLGTQGEGDGDGEDDEGGSAVGASRTAYTFSD